MLNRFRLIEVHVINTDQRQTNFARRDDQLFGENLRKFEFFGSDGRVLNDDSVVTVLLGQNGTGKSRLMRDVLSIFNFVETQKVIFPLSLVRKNCVRKIKYSYDEHFCEIEIHPSREVLTRVNRVTCHPKEVPLPTRFIASSSSPFDKFPYPRTKRRIEQDGKDQDRYAYLGLKDRSGRASGSRALMNTIANLAELSDKDQSRNIAVAEVFRFLGYTPILDLEYKFTGPLQKYYNLFQSDLFEETIFENNRSNFDPAVEYLNQYSQNRSSLPPPSLLDKIATQVRVKNFTTEEISTAFHQISKNISGSRNVQMRLDFMSNRKTDNQFSQIQILRKTGILRLQSVESNRTDGTKLDFKEVSSGEFAIALGIIGIASVIENGSVIFIDEPEISLHPAWQDKYLELLLRSFSNFKGCHFILATHSPLILSDVDPKKSNIVTMGSENETEANDVSGASTDELLLNVFDVTTGNNSYLKQQLTIALALISEGKFQSEQFLEIADELEQVLQKMDRENRAYDLIKSILSIQLESD